MCPSEDNEGREVNFLKSTQLLAVNVFLQKLSKRESNFFVYLFYYKPFNFAVMLGNRLNNSVHRTT